MIPVAYTSAHLIATLRVSDWLRFVPEQLRLPQIFPKDFQHDTILGYCFEYTGIMVRRETQPNHLKRLANQSETHSHLIAILRPRRFEQGIHRQGRVFTRRV